VLRLKKFNTESKEILGEMRKKPAPEDRSHLKEKKCRIAGIL